MLRWRVELRDGTALTLDRTYMDVASDDVLEHPTIELNQT
jgi:hypothetical protein